MEEIFVPDICLFVSQENEREREIKRRYTIALHYGFTWVLQTFLYFKRCN